MLPYKFKHINRFESVGYVTSVKITGIFQNSWSFQNTAHVLAC